MRTAQGCRLQELAVTFRSAVLFEFGGGGRGGGGGSSKVLEHVWDWQTDLHRPWPKQVPSRGDCGVLVVLYTCLVLLGELGCGVTRLGHDFGQMSAADRTFVVCQLRSRIALTILSDLVLQRRFSGTREATELADSGVRG